MAGNKIIWQSRPMIIALGYFAMRLKSSTLNDNPRPIIMTAKAIGKITVDNRLACIIDSL
jgi:hypothetical protein